MGISNLIDFEIIKRHAPALLNGHTNSNQMACVRPEDVRIVPGGTGARVQSVQFLGNITRLQLDWAGRRLTAEQAGDVSLPVGTDVGVEFAAGKHFWVSVS